MKKFHDRIYQTIMETLENEGYCPAHLGNMGFGYLSGGINGQWIWARECPNDMKREFTLREKILYYIPDAFGITSKGVINQYAPPNKIIKPRDLKNRRLYPDLSKIGIINIKGKEKYYSPYGSILYKSATIGRIEQSPVPQDLRSLIRIGVFGEENISQLEALRQMIREELGLETKLELDEVNGFDAIIRRTSLEDEGFT